MHYLAQKGDLFQTYNNISLGQVDQKIHFPFHLFILLLSQWLFHPQIIWPNPSYTDLKLNNCNAVEDLQQEKYRKQARNGLQLQSLDS